MVKAPGEALRDKVAQLLRIKYQDVVVEHRLKTTTADVIFLDDTNPLFPRSIAIETKDWQKKLTSSDVAEIYNLYEPSLRSGEIANLWIIGQHPLAGSPRLSLTQLTGVRYSTFSEFRASLMNFTNLLQSNILRFKNDEVSKYFVETRVRNSSQTLLQFVEGWLTLKDYGAIIYGGYGLGKTTFSLYLASVLSKRYLEDSFDRIPIRISLGGMYSKQDLVALICAALSGGEGGAVVKDFSYGLFLEMNRQGQYLLILDGFDEMRHAMDLDDFVYTFEQMRPLFSGKAKVIILGRPDSFLTSEEEQQVLTALFEEHLDTGSRIKTVEVAFFSKPEVESYLGQYLDQRSPKLTAEQRANYDALMSVLPDAEDNILCRPVQLNMFTKIIGECLAERSNLNRRQLYKKFIYRFVMRESSKPARKPTQSFRKVVTHEDRETFMQAMAWWILNVKRENRFLPAEIPLNIVPTSIRFGRTGDAAIREAIVGSIVEPVSRAGVLSSKAKKYYYFPHKSYIEFLIAEYFENNVFSKGIYRDCIKNLNPEILAFLQEGGQKGIQLLREGLNYSIGNVDAKIVEVCAKDENIKSEISKQNRGNHRPHEIYLHYFYLKYN